jgi:putative ABC transport system permease protein
MVSQQLFMGSVIMALGQLGHDLRHALRTLRGSPGFTLTAVLMMGLAIGALAGLSGVVRQVLLTPLPFAQPERLVSILGTAPGSALPDEFGLSAEFVLHYGERSQLIEQIGSYNNFTNTLRVGDRVERVWMSSPPASLFATLGVAPALGRLPGPGDDTSVVVLSDRLWQDWFARDPKVVGSSVDLFGAPRTVVGVMPPSFHFPTDSVLLWISRQTTAADIRNVGDFGMGVVARLKPGVEPAALATELTQLSKELPERFGGSAAYADIVARHSAVVRPLDQQLLGAYAQPLWLLLGACCLVLLIACANLANLLLVRAEARQRELALRRAIGASRIELLRLQLSEAAVLGLMSGTLACAIALVGLPLLLQAAPAGIPRLSEVHLDAWTIAVAFGTALLGCIACALFPALRGLAPDLTRLRNGGRGATTRHHWPRQALVAGQTALTLTLLIGAGLLMRSAQAVYAADPGYDPRDVFTFQFAPEQQSLSEPRDWARFHQQFLQRLAALPGVQRVGLVENVPLNEGTADIRARTESMAGPAAAGALLNLTYTAGAYFPAMDIRVLSGRAFVADDHEGRGNLIVSQRAADLLWPGQEAVGQRLQREGQTQWETVIGVVENVQQYALNGTPEPLIYLPLLGPDPASSAMLSSPAYVIKTARADQIAGEVRALIHEVAPEAPMYRQYTMQQLVDDSMVQLTFTLLTLSLAAALSLLLGAIGLYGVLSYVVAERTREIGVRMALGAPVRSVRLMIVAQGTSVAAVGVIIGLGAAALVCEALDQSLLNGVKPQDPATYLVMALTLLAIAALASDLPARRAARMNPVLAMRRD